MILSVLIPAIPSRRTQAGALYEKLMMQARSHDVEILLLTDNKRRTVGAKRQALVDIARGDYLAFVDDDDDVLDGYIDKIVKKACAWPGEVIVFPSLCTLNGGPTVRIDHSRHYENEQYNPAGFKRKPWHIHAWCKQLAKAARFPDVTGYEDWPWCEQMLPHVKTEALASTAPLYHYRFDSRTSESPQNWEPEVEKMMEPEAG
jgi:hypothetical protein